MLPMYPEGGYHRENRSDSRRVAAHHRLGLPRANAKRLPIDGAGAWPDGGEVQ